MSAPQSSSSEARVWDALAPHYDSTRASDPVYIAAVEQVIADSHAHGTVLDAGCGTGFVSRELLRRSLQVTAIDFSAASVELLKSSCSGTLHADVGDIRTLPYADATFDTVICANTLQHLVPADQAIAARELMRVLKPGGTYSISVHHFSREKEKAGWKKSGAPGDRSVDYIYRFSREELSGLFPGAQIRAVGFYGFRWQGLAAAAGHMLARRGHGHMLIAHGRKTSA